MDTRITVIESEFRDSLEKGHIFLDAKGEKKKLWNT
jgi:hypothetical protein